MKALENKNPKPNDKSEPIITQQPTKKLNTFKWVYRNNNYGMKVGGL